jgi:hypothetical protein
VSRRQKGPTGRALSVIVVITPFDGQAFVEQGVAADSGVPEAEQPERLDIALEMSLTFSRASMGS